MPLKNADSIVKMYFEADRSAVRERYESIYGLKPCDNAADDSSDDQADAEGDLSIDDTVPSAGDGDTANGLPDDADLDARFNEVLTLTGVNDSLLEPLRMRWAYRHAEEKLIALHYVACLYDKKYTVDHALEGMISTFHTWDASPFLHAVEPEIAFPIDGELSYLRLRTILDTLGIEFDDSDKLTEYEAWLNLSTAVHTWARDRELEPWQSWAAVYDLGPRLLEPAPPYAVDRNPRVWVIATNDDFDEFEKIDQHGAEAVGTWAINKGAQRGDLALMYCVRPRSAIVAVYRVLEDAHRDPFGGWNGFRGEVGEKITIPWITLTDMRNDPVLSQWKLVRGNFQGLLKHEVPESAWMRIKEIVAAADPATGERLDGLGRAAHGVRELRVSGEKWTELEVEDRLIIPLLTALGWQPGRTLLQQVEMSIKIGSGRPQKVRADFVGYSGELTSQARMVLEAKRRIANTRELEYAAQQAESYAGRLRCPRYAVAAPEGIWVYELQFPGQSRLLATFELENQSTELLARSLRDHLGCDVLNA